MASPSPIIEAWRQQSSRGGDDGESSETAGAADQGAGPEGEARGGGDAQKVAYGSEPGFPISMAMRAGDFVFTSAQGDHGFNPPDVVYDEKGLVVSDGNTLPPRSMAEETRSHLAQPPGEPGGGRLRPGGCGRYLGLAARSARFPRR